MKILLVEDDRFFREFYSMKLKEKGDEVDVAADGEEALVKIKASKPEIMLLDLIMPKKDGFEVLEALVKENVISQIRILVFSTLSQEKDTERAMQLGAKGYVDKSFFDFDKLYERILQIAKK